MCGLFGFIGRKPDVTLLTACALEASRRGPHAFGFAWMNGRIHAHRQSGNLADHLNTLLPHVGSGWLIGNARLATSGTWRDTRNNQPLLADRLAVVHNGNVYNSRELFEQSGYVPETQSDSEAIVALLHHRSGSIKERIAAIKALVDHRSPMALLIGWEQKLFALSYGQPLYATTHSGDIYFCSRPLNRTSALLPYGEVIEYE